MTRPNATTLTCPEGTSPCSVHTKPNNTVCYPASDHDSSCPITEIKFYNSSTTGPLNATEDLTFTDGYNLAYGRDAD